jgi:peptide/bleomycin uptake transporter
MIKSFFWSKKWRLWAWGGAAFLLASLYAQVYMSVLINEWYGEFYNLLQQAPNYFNGEACGGADYGYIICSKEGIALFIAGLWKFCWIALPYVALAVITGYFTRLYGFRWREAMTFSYIPRWQKVKEDIEGSSQRIQQDTERFARIVEGLGLQVVRAVMTLVAFLPLLWTLSSKVDIDWVKDIPGSLVWLALIVSIGGLGISWLVGWFLPKLEYNNQKVEAAYRKELVLGETDKKNYCSMKSLVELFTGLKFNYHRLFLHYGYFDLWVNLYDQFMVIVPYLVMGPGLFTGVITLGTMVQVSNAFMKVHSSFALFIHRWTTITELRSIWKRLHEFERNLERYNK